jgi:hypothetical protein
MRLPIFIWSTGLLLVSAAGLEQHVQIADLELSVAVYTVCIGIVLSVIAYVVILAAAVVISSAPVGKSHGAEPRNFCINRYLADHRRRPFSCAATSPLTRASSRPF